MNFDTIADHKAGESVLAYLAAGEPMTAEELAAEADRRRAAVRAQLDRLAVALRDDRWAQSTTGVGLIRIMADLIDGCPADLHAFIAATIDPKRSAFRPHRVSQYVKARHGVSISNHTVKAMLGKVAATTAGRSPRGGRPMAGESNGSARTSGAAAAAATRQRRLPPPLRLVNRYFNPDGPD